MKKNEEMSKLIVSRFKTLLLELKSLDTAYSKLSNERIELGNKLNGYKDAKTEINQEIRDIFKSLADSNSVYVKMSQTIDNYMNKIKELNTVITITGIEPELNEHQNLILKDCLDNVVENFIVDGDKVMEKQMDNGLVKDMYEKMVVETISNYEKRYNSMIGHA